MVVVAVLGLVTRKRHVAVATFFGVLAELVELFEDGHLGRDGADASPREQV